MGQYVGPGNVPYIVVNVNDGIDLYRKWNKYIGNYPIYLPSGTYQLPNNLTFLYTANAKTIQLLGGGVRDTVIIGKNAAEPIIDISPDAPAGSWLPTTFYLDQLQLQGGGTNQTVGLHLVNTTLEAGTFEVNGTFAANSYGVQLESNAAGAPCRSSNIRSLTVFPTAGADQIGFRACSEGLFIGSLSIANTNINKASNAWFMAEGTGISIGKLLAYMGGAKNCAGSYVLNSYKSSVAVADFGIFCDVHPASFPELIRSTPDGATHEGGVSIQHLFSNDLVHITSCTMFHDAGSAASTKIGNVLDEGDFETQAGGAWTDPTCVAWEGRHRLVYNSNIGAYRMYHYINAGWHYVALT